MELEDIKRTISTTEGQLDSILKALEKSRGEFKDALSAFAIDWVEKELERYLIKENPEKARQLGVVGMAPIKKDLKELQKRLPEVVNGTVFDDSAWPHREEFLKKMGSKPKDLCFRIDEYLLQIIHRVINSLGPILKQYSLVPFDHRNAWQLDNGKPYHNHNYGFNLSEALRKALGDYIEEFREMERAQGALQKLLEEKAQAEARLLWEKS